MKKISIIIPTYNRKNELIRAINSVLKQTYIFWELLIVDNHSSDGTLNYINSIDDHRIRFLSINNNGVIASSRNLGIRQSTGEYIAFLDSDDWWKDDKLEKSIAYLERGYDFIYHSMEITSSSKPRPSLFNKKIKTWDLKNPEKDLINNGNAVCTSSVVVSAEIIKEIKGFSENKQLIGAEDYDCWIRIAKKTNKFKNINSSLGYWFYGNNTSNPLLTIINSEKIKNLYFKDNKNPIWYDYSINRSYYLLSEYKKAQVGIINLIFRDNVDFILRAKSCYMLIQCIIRLHFRKTQ